MKKYGFNLSELKVLIKENEEISLKIEERINEKTENADTWSKRKKTSRYL
jgi:hypothetical protein